MKEGTETPCAFGGAGKQGEKEGEGNAEGPAGAERSGSGAGAARNAGRGFPTCLGPLGPHFPSSASPTASGLGRAAHTGAKAAAAGSLMGETGRRGPGGGGWNAALMAAVQEVAIPDSPRNVQPRTGLV